MGGKKRRGGGVGAAAALSGGTTEAAAAGAVAPTSSATYATFSHVKPSSTVTYHSVTAGEPGIVAPQPGGGAWDVHVPEDPQAIGWDDTTPEAKLSNVAPPRRELTQAWISQHPPIASQGEPDWVSSSHSRYSFSNGNENGNNQHEVAEDKVDEADHKPPSSSPEPDVTQHNTPTSAHEPTQGPEQEAVLPHAESQHQASPAEFILPRDMRDVTTLFIAALPSITQMDTTELHTRLLAHMSTYAPIYELRVKAGATAPFAFAAYANPRLAAQGSKAHHSTFEGRSIRIELAGLERHIDVECTGPVDHKELARLISRRVRSTAQLPPILRPASNVGKVMLAEKTLLHVARTFGSAFVLSRAAVRGMQSWTLEFDTHASAGEFLFCLNELPATDAFHICFTRTYQQRQSFGRSYYPHTSNYGSKYYGAQGSIASRQQQQQWPAQFAGYSTPFPQATYDTIAPRPDESSGSAEQRVGDESTSSAPVTPWLQSDASLNTATASTSGVSTPHQSFGSPSQMESPYPHAPVITSGAAGNAWAPYYSGPPTKLERTLDPNGIWIGLFPPTMSRELEATLRPIFEAHGSVTEFKAVMTYYACPQPKAMVFVQFETPEAARSALSESGKVLGNGVKMLVKPRERRQTVPVQSSPQVSGFFPAPAPSPVVPPPMMEPVSSDAAPVGDVNFMGMGDVASALPTPATEEGLVLGLSRFDLCAEQPGSQSKTPLEQSQSLPGSKEDEAVFPQNTPAMPDFGESSTPKPALSESSETQSPGVPSGRGSQAVSQAFAVAQAQVTGRQYQQQHKGKGNFKRRFTPPHTHGADTPGGERLKVSRAGQNTPTSSAFASAGLPPTPQFRGVSGSSAAWPGSLRAMAPGMYQVRPPSLVAHAGYMNTSQPAAPPLLMPIMLPTLQAPLAGAPLHFMHNVSMPATSSSGGVGATTAPSRPHSLPSPAVQPWQSHPLQPAPGAYGQSQQVQSPQAPFQTPLVYPHGVMQAQQQGFLPRVPQPESYSTPLYTVPMMPAAQHAGSGYEAVPEMPITAAAAQAFHDPTGQVRAVSPGPQLYPVPNDIPAWASSD